MTNTITITMNDKHARTRTLFDRAVDAIASLSASASPGESISLSNQQLLHFYSLYKQATVGDLPTTTLRRPGLFDLRGRAKYDAWLAVRGTPQHVAMRQYVDLFMAFLRKFPDRPIAQQLLAEFVNEGAMVSQVASSASTSLVHVTGPPSDESDRDHDDGEDQEHLRQQEVWDRSRPSMGHPSPQTRRRASIATLETDAGGASFYSATATADEQDSDSSMPEDSDDDGSETASETMVAAGGLDTTMITPGPVPKPVLAAAAAHHHHHHHHHYAPGAAAAGSGSSSTSSLTTAFYRPDDTRSVTSVATVRPPPAGAPTAGSDLARSWVTPDSPPPLSTSVPTGAVVGGGSAEHFSNTSPRRSTIVRSPVRSPPSPAVTPSTLAKDDPVVAALHAQIAYLQAQLPRGTSTASASASAAVSVQRRSWLVRVLRTSTGLAWRWLVRSVIAWVMLATVGRELRRRKSRVYQVVEWLVKVAVGAESF